MFDRVIGQSFRTEAKPFVERMMDMARVAFRKLFSMAGLKQTNSGPATPHR